MSNLTTLLAFAQQLADAARPQALRYFRQPLTVDYKSDDSPVTKADRETESVLRHIITTHYPTHGIFGEEHGSQDLEREWVWVLDPIDGTKGFICGVPLFGCLIALLHYGRPVLGVVEMPALGERWVGMVGQTTWREQICHTSGRTELAQASVFATTPDMFTGADAQRFEQLSRAARFRRFGSDCYAYGLLASGLVDAVVEVDLKPYDYLALVPVIEGAGGIITDWNGQALGLHSDGRVVAAATAQLHKQILHYLQD